LNGGGTIGLAAVSAIPSSIAPGSAGIKADFSQGISNVGVALPTVGRIKGTGMVIKSVKKIKPLKIKGGIKL